MRIDPNAKTADLPESRGTSRSASARMQPQAEVGKDKATLVGHTRVEQLQQQLKAARSHGRKKSKL